MCQKCVFSLSVTHRVAQSIKLENMTAAVRLVRLVLRSHRPHSRDFRLNDFVGKMFHLIIIYFYYSYCRDVLEMLDGSGCHLFHNVTVHTICVYLTNAADRCDERSLADAAYVSAERRAMPTEHTVRELQFSI